MIILGGNLHEHLLLVEQLLVGNLHIPAQHCLQALPASLALQLSYTLVLKPI